MSNTVVSLSAPAKLNLRLVVTGRRANGYHELDMLNVNLAWGDLMRVSVGEGDRITLRQSELSTVQLPRETLAPEKNLVTRAAFEFRKFFGGRIGLDIELEKHIPTGAGLGGGSSDAGALLRWLWSRQEPEFRRERRSELVRIAAELGADIPYFLVGGPARIRGIGDEVAPLCPGAAHVPSRGCEVALVLPRLEIPTPAVYARLRSSGRGFAAEDPAVWSEQLMLVSATLSTLLRNDLEESILECEPGLGSLLGELRAIRGCAVAITGSGAALFCLAQEEGKLPVPEIKAVAERFGARTVLSSIQEAQFTDSILD